MTPTQPPAWAMEAAKEIAQATEAASRAANGPRFTFQEYTDEVATIIASKIPQQQPLPIAGLEYGVSLCDAKNLPLKNAAYRVACDEIKVSLQAAMERVMVGEQMESVAYIQD